MKQLLLVLLCLYSSYFVGQIAAKKQNTILKYFSNSSIKPREEFSPSLYPFKDHKFVIAIVGQNNGAFVDKTLKSALMQKYSQFRVVYIDDGSTDGSLNQAQNVVQDMKWQSLVTFYQNLEPLGYLQCLLQIANSCLDDEILIPLGGEDLLSHIWVLEKLNRYFANPDLWMVTSLHLEYPSYKEPENASLFDIKNPRKGPFDSWNLKAFYAALVKKMDPTDMTINSQFMPDTCEIAYRIPLLEMAEDHVLFINEILYLKNTKNQSTSKIPSEYESYILNRAPYAPLTHLFNFSESIGSHE